MFDRISWRKYENFHKNNFDCFAREVAFKAEKIHNEHREIDMNERYGVKKHR